MSVPSSEPPRSAAYASILRAPAALNSSPSSLPRQVNTTAISATSAMNVAVLASSSGHAATPPSLPHSAILGSGNRIRVIPSSGAKASSAASSVSHGKVRSRRRCPRLPSPVPIPRPRKTTIRIRLPK